LVLSSQSKPKKQMRTVPNYLPKKSISKILLIGTGSVQFSAKRFGASFSMKEIHDCDYYST